MRYWIGNVLRWFLETREEREARDRIDLLNAMERNAMERAAFRGAWNPVGNMVGNTVGMRSLAGAGTCALNGLGYALGGDAGRHTYRGGSPI
jgi:hypothetical protein